MQFNATYQVLGISKSLSIDTKNEVNFYVQVGALIA